MRAVTRVCIAVILFALLDGGHCSQARLEKNVHVRHDCWNIANVTKDHTLQCYEVEVPINHWNATDTRKARLPVVFYPAGGGNTSQNDTLGTIWFRFGGPGSSGVDVLTYGAASPNGSAAATHDRSYNSRYNIASWDQRGLHRTQMVSTCYRFRDQAIYRSARAMVHRAYTSPKANDMEISFITKEIKAYAELCRTSVHADTFRYMSTLDTVRDMRLLYRSMGDTHLNLEGHSYGTLLGQIFAKFYPEEVGKMVLDGVVDPVPWYEGKQYNIQQDSEKAQEAFFEACERAQDDCALATLARKRGTSVSKMMADKTESILVDGPDYALNGSELFVTYSDFVGDMRGLTNLPVFWNAGAKLFAEWVDGNASAAVRHDNGQIETDDGYLYDMNDAVLGLDIERRSKDWSVKSFRSFMDETSKVLPTFFSAYVRYSFLNTHWPFDAQSKFDYAAEDWAPQANDSADPRILFMSSALDPMTAYRGAVASAQRFRNSILLKLNAIGHQTLSMPSKCVDAARRDFMLGNMTKSQMSRTFDSTTGEVLPSIECEPTKKFEEFFAPPNKTSPDSGRESAERVVALMNHHRRAVPM